MLKTKILFLSCFILFLIAGTCIAGQVKGINTDKMTATVLAPPKIIKAFELKNTDEKKFTQENLKGHWTFLFFGFTRCGYVCPTSMGTLKQAYETIQKDRSISKPQVVFVSIDPDRDDLQRVRRYVTSFNPDFKGATGDKAALSQITSQLGVLSMKIVRKGSSSNNYDIDHTGSIMLVDPAGELIAIFTMPHNADHIAKDYEAIVKHYVS